MRYVLAWIVYRVGDAISRLDDIPGLWFTFYPIYNRLLLLSDDIQGSGRGPWEGGE